MDLSWIKNLLRFLGTSRYLNIASCIAVLLLCTCKDKPVAISNSSFPIENEKIEVIRDTQSSETIVAEPIIDFDTTLWTDLELSDDRLIMDIRYATKNNFVAEQMYDCPRCFLRPEAAKALYEVHESLRQLGYGLKLFDCYRPSPIQEKLWQKVPNPSYVTPPHKGSMHNRGYAVDATLVDSLGVELDMGTDFDFFGRKAHHDFYDLDAAILERRIILKESMASSGFKHIRTEWWHYAYRGPYTSPFELADFQWPCQ